VARALRPFLLAVLLALVAASSASARSLYDPDVLSFTGGPPTDDLTILSGTCIFNTDTGEMTGACTRPASLGDVQSGIGTATVSGAEFGETATEFVFDSLTLANGANITVIGNPDLVIAARNNMDIEGTVNVNAIRGSGFGSGDFPPSTPCGGSGGGGSYGGLGGAGGDGTASGGIYGSADLSSDLLHGSPGGDSSFPSCGSHTTGGAGGGAVGLVALGSLTINGLVTANGAAPSGPDPLTDQGGPGGGSGGAVLLMSPDLSLANQSVISAKGGNGGNSSFTDGDGGGGGGGGRIAYVGDLPDGSVAVDASTSGFGGTSSSGTPGEEGNGGSVGPLPYMTVSGPSSKRAGQSASFSTSLAAGDATYAWDFGDGANGTGLAPSHTYTAQGTYNVTVTATLTDSGATATAHRSITITPALPVSGGGGGGGGNPQPQPQPPAPTPAVTPCVVPRLAGLSLSAARRKLSRAHCKLGKVKKPKLKKSAKKKPTLVVARQSPAAGRKLANGSKVNVTLTVKKPKRHKHR